MCESIRKMRLFANVLEDIYYILDKLDGEDGDEHLAMIYKKLSVEVTRELAMGLIHLCNETEYELKKELKD